MVQQVSPLGCLQIPSTLVAIEMAMPHSTVLEGPVAEGTHHAEALLSRLLRLKLELLDFALSGGFGTDFTHFKTERS